MSQVFSFNKSILMSVPCIYVGVINRQKMFPIKKRKTHHMIGRGAAAMKTLSTLYLTLPLLRQR